MLSRSQDPSLDMDERLRILYPMVNEAETPLPRDAKKRTRQIKAIAILEENDSNNTLPSLVLSRILDVMMYDVKDQIQLREFL